MSSDEEPAINNIVPEHETQFVPRSDDDEVLWSVVEITAERGKKYKVKWAGTDPATGKPWAQSWVAKHDCTDDLVVEWKTKKQRPTTKKKRGGGVRTGSRASGPSKRGESSTSGKVTRPSTSEATVPRSEPRSLPPKKAGMKRKRESGTIVATSSGMGDTGQQNEPPPPSKKQKMNTTMEKLVPPLSSDEDEDVPPVSDPRAKVALRKKASLKTTTDALVDDDIPPLPKSKGKSVHRLDVRSKGTAVSPASDEQRESKTRDSKAKAEVVIRRKERIVHSPTSQDEEPRSRNSKEEVDSISHSEQENGPSEEEDVSTASPIKVGPPRGVTREVQLRKSGPSSKPGPLPQKDDSDEEHGAKEKSKRPCNDVSAFGKPLLLQQDRVDTPPLDQPPLRLSIPPAPLSIRPNSPDLSPGARARLELFDQMMVDPSRPGTAPPPDVPEHVSDDTHFNYDDNYNDDYDVHDTSYPPPQLNTSLPKPQSKHLKPGTANGLVVPETESSGNSQSQTQPLGKSPPPQPSPVLDSSHQPASLPTIAISAASAKSSSPSPESCLPLPREPMSSTRFPLARLRQVKRAAVGPVPQISPNTFRSKVRTYVGDLEAPPSSIESFTSPKRLDKGKQKAIEVDQLESSLSEADGDGERRKKPKQGKITDLGLKKRGQELFNQAQFARETERRKKKKVKQLKSLDDIVKWTASSPVREPSVPYNGGVESTMEPYWEEVIDLTGGANSTTLDTAEHSEPKPLSEEERERLRVELRQEEEESTQEALGICPPPVEGPMLVNGQGAEMPPPGSSEHSSLVNQTEDVDHVEQPSTDVQLASVIVQPSQEQRHEDTDIDPSPATRPTSSPARPIPENLTDSPKRRLGEALSLLNVKSEEIQRLERELADERKNVQDLKSELAETQQSSEPTGPVRAAWDAERAEWTRDRSKWEKDMVTWEAQRKEWDDDKANLSVRVAELLEVAARVEQVGVKMSELEAERAAWIEERERLRGEITQRSEELEAERVISTEERKRLQGEITQRSEELEAERVTWTDERKRLRGEITQRSEELEAERVAWIEERKRLQGEATQRSEELGAERVAWTEERKRLQGEATQRSEELEAERVAWTEDRERLQSEITQQSEELAVLAKARNEQEQERLKWETERASWAEEKVRWEAERAPLQEKQEASLRSVDELTASLESLASATVSAEKDRDFFREQYTQASAFVSSVREENLELEKRTKIAEGQAREGVAAIKAFYEGRIKALQADAGRLKGLTELLQEKDKRTNDELRARAAQTPELQHLCGRLKAENKTLEAEVRKLARAQHRNLSQKNKLYLRVFALKKERGSLKSKLSKVSKVANSDTVEASLVVSAPLVVEDPENMDPNDMEILSDPTPLTLDSIADEPALFPCMWRPQWRDQCQHVFDAKEDLERHMLEHFRDLLSE